MTPPPLIHTAVKLCPGPWALPCTVKYRLANSMCLFNRIQHGASCTCPPPQNNYHNVRLEWIVIWLIVVEVVVGLFELLGLFGVVGAHSRA